MASSPLTQPGASYPIHAGKHDGLRATEEAGDGCRREPEQIRRAPEGVAPTPAGTDMPRCDPILIDCDCPDPKCLHRFRLSDLVRGACLRTRDPERRKAYVEAWLRGYHEAHVYANRICQTPDECGGADR